MTHSIESPSVRTIELLDKLVALDATPLLGGDFDDDVDEHGVQVSIGVAHSGDITVAVYHEAVRTEVDNLLTDQLRMTVQGVHGYVKFSQDAGQSECFGSLFVTEEQVVCSMFTKVSAMDLGSNALLECFDAANEVGVGDIWTTSLLDILRGAEPTNVSEQVVLMSDPAIEYLNARLALYVEDRAQA